MKINGKKVVTPDVTKRPNSCAAPTVLCSGASAPEQRLVLLLPPQHKNVGPQPPRQRANPFLFFLFLSQHGIFAPHTHIGTGIRFLAPPFRPHPTSLLASKLAATRHVVQHRWAR